MIFFFSTRWYKLPSCRVTLFFQVKLNSPNGLRSPFEIKWISLSHSPIRVFRISPRIEAKTSKMTNNHRIVSNRRVSCLQNFSPIKKNFSPLKMLFPQKVHEARPFQRLNVYPTCPKCARNAPRGCLAPWNLRFRLLGSRKKRKKKKKRVEFHFDEQATRESRVSCRFSREKYTHRSILFITCALVKIILDEGERRKRGRTRGNWISDSVASESYLGNQFRQQRNKRPR